MSIKMTKSEFVEQSNKIHNFKYTYEVVEFTTTKTKVVITCPTHGDFEQRANNHLRGQGCLKCSSKHRFTTEEFITKSNEVHSNKYTYEKVVYTTAVNKVTITCPTHGDFEQVARAHMQGNGCPKCGGTHNYNTEEFIVKANEVHNSYYTYSKTLYARSKDKVTITCPIHGDFKQQAQAHLQGYGCHNCGKGGFKVAKPGVLYYLSVLGGTAYKIGITNHTVEKRFNKDDMDIIKIIKVWKFADGQECYDKEQEIIKEYSEYKYLGSSLLKNGNSELFNKDILLLDGADSAYKV